MRSLLTSVAIILMTVTAVPRAAHPLETGPFIGKQAPDFELKDLAGKTARLADFRGTVVLLNFWATWCGPCKAEMPPLNDLHTAFKDRDFTVLAVSQDHSEKPVLALVRDRGISFPVLMDAATEVSFDLYAVMNLPTSFLIDRNGMIVEKFIGERDWKSPEIKNRISDLIRKK